MTKPIPSLPIGFWGDPECRRYYESYFDTFPGVWRHGDWLQLISHPEAVGGIVFGRSNATINRQGIRMGSSEIYRVVESFPEVADSFSRLATPPMRSLRFRRSLTRSQVKKWKSLSRKFCWASPPIPQPTVMPWAIRNPKTGLLNLLAVEILDTMPPMGFRKERIGRKCKTPFLWSNTSHPDIIYFIV